MHVKIEFSYQKFKGVPRTGVVLGHNLALSKLAKTTFSNAIYWKNVLQMSLTFLLESIWQTYLAQWWPSSLTHICVTGSQRRVESWNTFKTMLKIRKIFTSRTGRLNFRALPGLARFSLQVLHLKLHSVNTNVCFVYLSRCVLFMYKLYWIIAQ